MTNVIDRHYRFIRPFRFLYGWAKDAHAKAQCSTRAAQWEAKSYRGAKLDICGGRNPYNPKQYLNVDCVALPQVDLVFDIRKRFPIDDGVIAEVLSVATLEHFRKHDVDHILKEFFRILAPGGLLRISTPDIEAVAKAIVEKSEDWEKIANHLFGKFKAEETDLWDLHKWMATADGMIAELETIGFKDVEQIPMDLGNHDPDLNYLIRAVKP